MTRHMMTMIHHKTSKISLCALAAFALAGCAFASPFRNTVNRPFATRCNGPQGAIVIPEDQVAGAAAYAMAVDDQHDPGKLRHAAATVDRLKRIGLVNRRATARFPRLAVHTRGNRLILPDLANTQAVGDLGDPGNVITFQYEGWTAPEQAVLEAYVTRAYPKARLIYGPPAFNITVKVIRDDSINALQGGIYDATTNEIRMPELTGNEPEDTFIFMMLILRAFHDDVSIFYDAWEEGFVGAAATAVQVQPSVSPQFDPKDPGPFYALSVYESENHPALGNSTFYPQGDFGGMFVWRVAMARAAWMKCWIEDSSFFANFNAQYYAQFTSALAGDVLGLRSLAATVLPTIEGLPFQEWYQRQYILDTSVRAGIKEFTWNIPLETAVVLIVEHYLTDEQGNEYVRGGQARTIYWSYDFSVNLYAEEGNLIDVPTTGDTPGEGFLIPTFFNIGGPQRVTVQLDLNNLRSYYPFPYGVRGFDPGQNNLYGGIINATGGKIDVTGGDDITDLAVNRGVWGDAIVTPDLSPLKLEVNYTNPDGDLLTRHVNVGWDSYVLYVDGGTQTTLARTFPFGVTGLHLMSLPITPVDGSAPSALGISSSDFLLARWDAAAPPEGVYRIWPDCEPFAYGRAYWLRVLQDTPVSVAGIQAPTEDRILIPLELGWNMFGSVRLDTVPVAALKVQVGTDAPVLMDEAISNHWVQKGIFGYGQTAGYATVDELVAFEGYWIRCLVPAGCRLVFEPISTASAQTTRTTSQQPDWKLPIHVKCGAFASSAAYLGADADASDGYDPGYDLQAPPSFGPYVAARFDVSEAGGAPCVSDVRGAQVHGQAWALTVTSTIPQEPLRVTWPDLSELPADVKPILVDPQTGRRLYMRTTPGYTVSAGLATQGYPLRIEVPDPSVGALVVSALSARSDRAGVSVAYSLSRSAAVSARVMNIAGRPIRSLVTERVQTSGVNSLAWNLSDNVGLKVPSGLYLIEIRARSDEGQDVRAVRTVQVSRR